MKNLVVCCDGTWNTPDQEHDGVPVPTNVVRLYNCVAEKHDDGTPQEKYYHPGVGTEGGWWKKVSGGTVGAGLGKNVMSAYKWLCGKYEPEARLYLFGFSRGAYTVRSLGGMISACGLLALQDLDEREVWKRVEQAFSEGYRKRINPAEWRGAWPVHSDPKTGEQIPIHFLGVWDTVGALGIPDDMAILNVFDDRSDYTFHDTTLSKSVQNARHALALDEIRASFSPTLWTEIEGDDRVKQIWFPGVHCDVGGGYPERGLSDAVLRWMALEAADKHLAFNARMLEQTTPSALDVLHDSRTGLFKELRTEPRNVPDLTAKGAPLHPSVLERQANPPIAQAPYRPARSVAPGESRSLTIYAAQPWNATDLFLEQGVKYRFRATGEWLDRNIRTGPGGASDGKFQPGEIVHLAGTLWGKAEGLFKRVTGNEEADFQGTRRHEEYPWFTLVGAVANGGNPGPDGTPASHEVFRIGDGCTFSPRASGYLFCYANDAWHFYDNNRGSVRVEIDRI